MSAGLTSETQPGASPEERLRWRKALRQQSVERRLSLSASQYAELSEKVSQHLREHFPQLAGMRVGFCWPVNNEPDLRPLIRSWSDSGKAGFTALLPVVQGHEMSLAFRAWTPESPMLTDRFGIPTPSAGPFIQPQAVLIPVNAFDAAGYRIGYGGGFFDRTLASIKPAPLSIGVGFELSRIASVHPEAHDVRLDAMVTESGVFSGSQPPQG